MDHDTTIITHQPAHLRLASDVAATMAKGYLTSSVVSHQSPHVIAAADDDLTAATHHSASVESHQSSCFLQRATVDLTAYIAVVYDTVITPCEDANGIASSGRASYVCVNNTQIQYARIA